MVLATRWKGSKFDFSLFPKSVFGVLTLLSKINNAPFHPCTQCTLMTTPPANLPSNWWWHGDPEPHQGQWWVVLWEHCVASGSLMYWEQPVSKMVEMVIDSQKHLSPYLRALKVVESTRFLITTINSDLKWEIHSSSVTERAKQRMLFPRLLQKMNISSRSVHSFPEPPPTCSARTTVKLLHGEAFFFFSSTGNVHIMGANPF